MAYIGNNPKLKSIVSSGDTLANLTAEPRKAGRLAYATDEGKFYYDDGSQLNPVGDCPNGVDTKVALDALGRVEGNLYYATDEDRLYVDNGTSLVAVSGVLPSLAKGSLVTSNGVNNGELLVGTDNFFLKALDAAPDGTGLQWSQAREVPSTGTIGHFLKKTGAGLLDYAFSAIREVTGGGSAGQVLTANGSGGYSWQTPSGGGMVINTSFKLNGGTNYTVPSGDFAYVTFIAGAASTQFTSSGSQTGIFVAAGGQVVNGSGLIAGRTQQSGMNSAMIVVMSN